MPALRTVIPQPPGKTVRVTDMITWDPRNWSRALDFWLANSEQSLSHCKALEIGARSGGLSLWMALHGATVECSDVGGPTDKAVESHREKGVASQITYSSIDARDIPYTDHFDVIAFKSVLGYLGAHGGKAAQQKGLTEMYKALKPGGELFFAENLVGSPLHMSMRRRFKGWGKSWRYVTLDEMGELLAPFSQVKTKAVGVTGALGRTLAQQQFLGTIDYWVLDRITPDKWKYIVVGVARK